jgi:hypothetical protein
MVSVTINGETTRVPLRVERMTGAAGTTPVIGGDDEEPEGRDGRMR